MVTITEELLEPIVRKYLLIRGDWQKITTKELRKYVENQLQLPEKSLKDPEKQTILINCVVNIQTNLLNQKENANEETNSNKNSNCDSNSSSGSGSDSDDESDSNKDRSEPFQTKRGRFSKAESDAIKTVLDSFMTENNISREDLVPALRENDSRVHRSVWKVLYNMFPNRTTRLLRALSFIVNELSPMQSVYMRGIRVCLDGYDTRFTEEEKQILAGLVNVYGHNFTKIGRIMGKYGAHCRDIYLRMKDRTKFGRFSEDEDERLVDLVLEQLEKVYPHLINNLPKLFEQVMKDHFNISWIDIEAKMNHERREVDYSRRWSAILRRNLVYRIIKNKIEGQNLVERERKKRSINKELNLKLLRYLKDGGFTDESELIWNRIQHQQEIPNPSYRWREIKSEARNDPEKPVTFDEIVDCMLARYESHTDEINHDNLDIETSDKVSNHTTGDLDSSEINTITSKRTHSSNDKKNSLVEKTKEGESDSDTDTDTDLSSSSSSSSSGMKMRQAPIIIHSSKVNSGAKDVASEQGNSSSLKKDNRKSKKKKMKKKNGRYDGVDGDAMDSEHNLDSHPKIKKMKRIKNHDGSHDKKTSRMKGLTNIKIKGYTSNDESLAKDNIRNGTTIEVGEKRREKKEKKMKKKKKEKDSIDQSSITSPPIKSRLNDSSARIISSQSVIELSSKKDKKRKWEANEVSNGSVVRGISLETLDDDRNRKKHKNKHHKRNK